LRKFTKTTRVAAASKLSNAEQDVRLLLGHYKALPEWFNENFAAPGCQLFRESAVANGTCLINAFLTSVSPTYRKLTEQWKTTVGVAVRQNLFEAWNRIKGAEKAETLTMATQWHMDDFKRIKKKKDPKDKYLFFLDEPTYYLGFPELRMLYHMYGVQVYVLLIDPTSGTDVYRIQTTGYYEGDDVRAPRVVLIHIDDNHYESVFSRCKGEDTFIFEPATAGYKAVQTGYRNMITNRTLKEGKAENKSRRAAASSQRGAASPRASPRRVPASPRRPGPPAAIVPKEFFPKMGWPNNYRYLVNLTKAIAHARGLVFAPVPKTLLQMLTDCPKRDDKSVAEHVRENKKGCTAEFVRYAVEINRILKKDVQGGHMCEVVIDTKKGGGKVWIPPMGKEYLAGSLGLNAKKGNKKGYFAGTSLMLALQMTDVGRTPTMHCVAVLAYAAVDNFNQDFYERFGKEIFYDEKQFIETPNRPEEPKAKILQAEMDKGQMLDISLLCARGANDAATRTHRQTVRLMTIYTIAKEMMRKKGGAPLYKSVFMDCAGYYTAGSKALKFDAETIAVELGFHRWNINFPQYPENTAASEKKYRGLNNRNEQYDFKTGTNRVYILSDAREAIYMKLLYYLEEHIVNSEMLKKVCPMKTGTKVPVCA